MESIVRGSCLCGGVRFEVRPPFLRANHCHCSRCRKHSGTAVCTQARVPREHGVATRGEPGHLGAEAGEVGPTGDGVDRILHALRRSQPA